VLVLVEKALYLEHHGDVSVMCSVHKLKVYNVTYLVFSKKNIRDVTRKIRKIVSSRRSGCCIVFGVSVCLSVRPLKIIDFMSTGPLDLFRVHFE